MPVVVAKADRWAEKVVPVVAVEAAEDMREVGPAVEGAVVAVGVVHSPVEEAVPAVEGAVVAVVVHILVEGAVVVAGVVHSPVEEAAVAGVVHSPVEVAVAVAGVVHNLAEEGAVVHIPVVGEGVVHILVDCHKKEGLLIGSVIIKDQEGVRSDYMFDC